MLDEPVAGLDPIGKKRLMSLLHTLHDTGIVKTIVIVSHDMNEICENVNRVALFCSGRAVKVCTPKELFTDKGESSSRLGLPVTAYLSEKLSEVGIEINSNFKTENFIKETVKKYKETV